MCSLNHLPRPFMNEDPGYKRAFSLHLSRTLDELGLNRRTVKRRGDAYLYSENVITTSTRICDCEHSPYFGRTYHFGSQTEGATTPGMNSDLDTLFSYDNYNVIQDWSDWERGKNNLLMLQEDTAPGYCRLQVLRSDIPAANQFVPNEHYTYDKTGRVIMKNTNLLNRKAPGINWVRNGPANSECGPTGLTDKDFVQAFCCRFWPEQTHAFIRRHRRYGWPSLRLIQQAVQQGVFLVPVGYKLSHTEHMEWRISASLAERCLMFSLSIVHIKCYVVLKMFAKTFIEPRVGKCISSYHCKTALLYCTENTEPEFWRDDNLLQCVTQCLVKLLAWVDDEFCPQFIIAEENLFAGKVTSQNKVILQSVLSELVKRSDRKLLNVQMDDLGLKLHRTLGTSPSDIPVLNSLSTIKLLLKFECEEHSFDHEHFKMALLLNKQAQSSTVVHFIILTIEMLKSIMRQSNKHELRAIQTCSTLFYHWFGSLLASISLAQKTRVPRYAIQILHYGGNSDVSSMLKLASVFYCNNDARKAGTLLQKVEHFYISNEIQSICGCCSHRYGITLSFCRRLIALKGKRTRATRFAPCVTFSPQEIHCAPPALRYELFKSVGDDMQHRHPTLDIWMDLAVVNCYPYLFYLQYITYRQLGQRELQTQALHNMDRFLFEEDIGHLETAWNLLGHCLELEQQPEGAMACYRTSLEIRPRNNAANWHISTLCYRLIRDRL